MSCIPVSSEMAFLLRLLAERTNGAEIDIEELRDLRSWDEAEQWGWITRQGDLTGAGWAHTDVGTRRGPVSR